MRKALREFIKAIRGTQEAIKRPTRSDHQRSSEAYVRRVSRDGGDHQRSSEVIRDHQRRTLVASPEMVAALRCPANASRAAVAYLMREAIEGVKLRTSSAAIIRGHPNQLEAIRSKRPSQSVWGHPTYARSRRSSSASQRMCGAAPAWAESHSPAPHPSSKRNGTLLPAVPSGGWSSGSSGSSTKSACKLSGVGAALPPSAPSVTPLWKTSLARPLAPPVSPITAFSWRRTAFPSASPRPASLRLRRERH